MVELDAKGKLVKEVAVEIDWAGHDKTVDKHHTFRQVRKTPEGTYLAAVMRLGVMIEWNADGTVLREFPLGIYAAVRLPNGNTLASAPRHGDGAGPLVVEYDASADVVWELEQTDLPFPVSMVCGVQRLPNGNTVISNVPHGPNADVVNQGEAPQLFEVTRDKKVVWQFKNWDLRNMGAFQIIDTNGVPISSDEIYR
jgi:hypothetical protein